MSTAFNILCICAKIYVQHMRASSEKMPPKYQHQILYSFFKAKKILKNELRFYAYPVVCFDFALCSNQR